MTRKLALMISAILLIYSCEKNDYSNENKKLEYFPMAVGNYWIYEEYQIEKDLTETKSSTFDSLSISKDTIINGNHYFKVECTYKIIPILRPNYYRDSSGYLVDLEGRIHFAQNNFTDTLYRRTEGNSDNPYCTITVKMEHVNNKITVPAGSFDVLNFKTTVIINPDYQNEWNPRYFDNYYSKNVGIITDSYSYLSQNFTVEKRLIRYKIQ